MAAALYWRHTGKAGSFGMAAAQHPRNGGSFGNYRGSMQMELWKRGLQMVLAGQHSAFGIAAALELPQLGNGGSLRMALA